MTERGIARRSEAFNAEAFGDVNVKRLDQVPGKPDTPDFSFDDSMFPPLEGKGTDLKLLNFEVPDDRARAAEVGSEPTIAELDDPMPGSPSGRSALSFLSDRITFRGLALALGLFGSAVLLGTLLFYSLRGGTGGSDLLARWRSSLAALKPASTGNRDLQAPPAPASTARTVAPARPGPRSAGTKKSSPPPAAKPAARPPTVIPRGLAPVAAVKPVSRPDAGDEDEALLIVANEFRLLGDRDRAEQIYLRLVREKRQPGRAALALGGLYLEQERFAEAYQMYERSRQFFGNPDGSAKARQ